MVREKTSWYSLHCSAYWFSLLVGLGRLLKGFNSCFWTLGREGMLMSLSGICILTKEEEDSGQRAQGGLLLGPTFDCSETQFYLMLRCPKASTSLFSSFTQSLHLPSIQICLNFIILKECPFDSAEKFLTAIITTQILSAGATVFIVLTFVMSG